MLGATCMESKLAKALKYVMLCVTITAEQAKLLNPILQEIAENDGSGRTESINMPCRLSMGPRALVVPAAAAVVGLLLIIMTVHSAFSTSASETEGGCRYDVEELFRKKGTRSQLKLKVTF